MTSLSIRPATSADIPAIAAIYGDAVVNGTASWEIEPPDEAELLRRLNAILAGGYPYLAAERDGLLVGYAYAGAYRPRPAYRSTVENSIYIAPDAQGSGVGAAGVACGVGVTATMGAIERGVPGVVAAQASSRASGRRRWRGIGR